MHIECEFCNPEKDLGKVANEKIGKIRRLLQHLPKSTKDIQQIKMIEELCA